jgi:regulator of protease activity HflC (stomatin/prohibitin superfamily)
MDEETAIKWGCIGAVVIVVVIWLATSIVPVGTGKVGVVTKFGKVTGREMSEGLNMKWPYPFNRVWVVDVKVQKEQVEANAASLDLQTVHSTLAVNYHLERGKVSEIYRTIGKEYKERIIDPAIQEAFKAVTARYTAAELLTKRPEVKDVALKLLEERLHKRGIIVDDLSIVNFDFSEEFNKAIEAKQVAQQESEKAQYNLERARKDAQAQEAQKQSLSAELLQKMAIERWDGKMPTYVGGGSIFNIPLTK